MNLIEEAKKIARSNARACEEDIDLLAKILERLDDTPTIVKLGANSAFSVAILATRPNASLWLVDSATEGQNWELKALENYGLNTNRLRRMVGVASRIAETYSGPKIDLLILDLSSSFQGVQDELNAWYKKMNLGNCYVFVHDYNGEEAPESYPEIAKAVDAFFPKRSSWYGGWSAVWWVKEK